MTHITASSALRARALSIYVLREVQKAERRSISGLARPAVNQTRGANTLQISGLPFRDEHRQRGVDNPSFVCQSHESQPVPSRLTKAHHVAA